VHAGRWIRPASRWRPLLAGIAAALLPLEAPRALQIDLLQVDRHNGIYTMQASSRLDAPPEFVLGILSDFDNFHRLAGGIAETRYLPPDEDGTPLAYTRIDSCVWVFCKAFEKVERVLVLPPDRLATVAVPESSDFALYNSLWQLEPEAGGTRVRFTATMTPKFWIPPMVGTWAIRRKLELTAEQVGRRVEYLFVTGLPLEQLEPVE
jgi:hypothetical protein